MDYLSIQWLCVCNAMQMLKLEISCSCMPQRQLHYLYRVYRLMNDDSHCQLNSVGANLIYPLH